MIGCEVLTLGICEVESGPSIYEADPTARVIDIKVFKRAKSLQIAQSLLLLLVPSFHQRKKEENLPWIDDRALLLQPRQLASAPAPAPAPLCRSSSTKKGLEYLIYLFFFFSPFPPIVLDTSESAPPQIHSIFSSPPSAPPQPRSSPPQIFSNGRRKGKSFGHRRPSSNPMFKGPPWRPTILSPNGHRRPSSPTAPPGLDPLAAAIPISVSWHMSIRDIHPRRCRNPLAATIPYEASIPS
ncbi:hypothetical protein AAC387_Pa04g0811 [Persea americana]